MTSTLLGKTVMVVEDDYSIRETLCELLSSEGYNVISAVNGEDGLSKIRSGPTPCLVLLDMMMPIMNGRQFLDRMMMDSVLSPIPVLVISAVGNAENTRGVRGFLRKPVDLDVILSTVHNICCA